MKMDLKNKLFPSRSDVKETGIKSTLKDIFTVDIVPKLLCVLAAVFLWFYVIETDSPTFEGTFSGVDIEFSDSSKGLEVLSSDRNTVEVVLSGKRSIINKMNNSDIKATVDISRITDAGQYVLDIKVSTLNETSVESYSPKTIYVYLDRSSSRTVAVRADYTGGTSDDKKLKIGTLEPSEKMVEVYGPEEILSQIEAAEVTVDVGLISRSVNVTNQAVRLVDSNGDTVSNAYMRTEPSSVDVYVPVYMEKELSVIPTFDHGYFDGSHIEYFASPSVVTVRGDIDIVEDMDAVHTASVDEMKIGKSATLQLDYMLPEGVSLSGVRGKCSMTLKIRDYQEKQIAIGTRNIAINGVSDAFSAEASKPLYITVQGSADALAPLTAHDFSAVADGTGLSVGEYDDVPVAVSFASDKISNAYISETNFITSVTVAEKHKTDND